MANGVARGRDEERERRTEDTRDRKIDIGTRSTGASEKRGGRREGGVGGRAVRGGRARKGRRGKRKARARTEYIDR